jgi:AraC-like DNA-binding protein
VIYRECLPSPALRSIVERLWWLEGPADEIAAEPIPPDGHPEIIIHAGDPFAQRVGDDDFRVQDRVLLAGQSTMAVRVMPRGYARVAGARLHPDGAHALFNVPQHELTNHIVDVRDLQPRLARQVHDDVIGRDDGEAIVSALDRALCATLASTRTSSASTSSSSSSSRLLVSAASIEASPARRAIAIANAQRGLVRVDALADAVDLSVRQLERQFQERVGLSPKLFLRIIRFQEVLRAVRTGPDALRWADLAMAHGFYDQAHFIRDCRLFAGASPSALNVSDDSLTALFSAVRRAPHGSRRMPDVAFFQDRDDVPA